MKELHNADVWTSTLQVMNRDTEVRKQRFVYLEQKESAGQSWHVRLDREVKKDLPRNVRIRECLCL